MSATVQRLLLSFIYVHRHDIPLSALTNFTDALFTAVSVVSTSGWIKLLVDLLKTFCFSRIKVCSDKMYDSRESDSAARKVFGRSDLPASNIHNRDVRVPEDISYTFSKQTADHASSVFHSLKEDVQHCQNGNSLWGPCYQFVHSKVQRMETENEFADMEIDINSEELFDACNVVATQLTRTNDEFKLLSQRQAGTVSYTHLTLPTILRV